MHDKASWTFRFSDWSITAWVAGFLAVLISYAGPLVIFIQAAQVGGISHAELASWVWGVSMGAGISGLLLSWWLKVPVITAWSAPGTALLISLFPDIGMPEVVGAYLTAAVITVVLGASGLFEKIVNWVPRGIAAGMMAGILFQFGAQAFRASMELPSLVFAMLGVYLIGKRLWPRYVVVLVAITGFALTFWMGKAQLTALQGVIVTPVFVAPVLNLSTFLSLTVPLVLVSLTGQYLPGIAVMRLAGYSFPSRPVVIGTGLASLGVACFGGISIVLASITASICTDKNAHPDADKRYVAGIATGVFYLIGGTFAGSIVLMFSTFPAALIATLAGLALIGAIVTNIRICVQEQDYVESSVITFLATASGMSLWGLGAAFWGAVLGLASYGLLKVSPVKA